MPARRRNRAIVIAIALGTLSPLLPKWVEYSVLAMIAAFLLLIVVTEILVSWRKSRPIPSMKSLSPQDATAVIGGAPVYLHPKRRP